MSNAKQNRVLYCLLHRARYTDRKNYARWSTYLLKLDRVKVISIYGNSY